MDSEAIRKGLISVLIILVCAGLLYAIIEVDQHVIFKGIAAIIILAATSKLLSRYLGIEEEYGLMLTRTEKGIEVYDWVAGLAPNLWRFLADLGMVLGFGVASIFIFKEIPKRTFFIGIITLMLFSQIILPTLSPLALEMINLPSNAQEMTLPGASLQSQGGLISALVLLFYYLITLATLLLGLAGSGIVLMGLKTISILLALSMFIATAVSGTIDSSSLATEGPGAAPILPGINLPLVEGILALAVLLFVHESAHAVLARVEKIRLKNAGIVFLGILPFGAFVEPDEKQLKRVKTEKQDRVLVAGSTANLLTAVVFFILLAGFQSYILSSYPDPTMFDESVYITGIQEGHPADGELLAGMQIIQWNGFNISTVEDFNAAANGTKENDTVSIVTNIHSVNLTAAAHGKVGVYVNAYKTQVKTFSERVNELSTNGEKWIGFLYNFLALALVLNVLVGIVNLFPIPPFDGYRIIALAVKNKRIMNLIIAAAIMMFLVNLMPWAWT